MDAEIAVFAPQFAVGGEAVARLDPVFRHDVAFRNPTPVIFVDKHQALTVENRFGDTVDVGRWHGLRFNRGPTWNPGAKRVSIVRLVVNIPTAAAVVLWFCLGSSDEWIGDVEWASRAFHRRARFPHSEPCARGVSGREGGLVRDGFNRIRTGPSFAECPRNPQSREKESVT